MAAARKTFIQGLKEEKENTLTAFIDTTGAAGRKDPDNPDTPLKKREAKSYRLNVLITPSAKKNMSKIAYMKRNSVNDLINRIMEKYIEDNRELINKYDEVFGKDEDQ